MTTISFDASKVKNGSVIEFSNHITFYFPYLNGNPTGEISRATYYHRFISAN